MNQPLEPDALTSQPPYADIHASQPIPIVEPEEIRASARSSRVADTIRCDLETVITSLSSLDRTRVNVITPDSEINCGSAIHLARNLAQKASTILVDMAAEGFASEEMAPSSQSLGLTDILAGASQVSNCVFRDKQSKSHILPKGRDSAQFNTNSMNLLPVVMDVLQQNYAYLVIDSGGADAAGLSLIAHEDTNIILSTVSDQSDEVDDRIVEIRQAGFAEPIVLEMR